MKKKRIAVIGGGVGAMTAAWSIASDPALRARTAVEKSATGAAG